MSDIFGSSSNDRFGSGQGGQNAGSGFSTAITQYGSETVVCAIKPGLTVGQMFASNADELGFDADRSVVYRCRGQQIDPNTAPVADAIYTASITHEQKGL